MAQCWNCQRSLPDGTKFCGKCGTRQEPTNASHLLEKTVSQPLSGWKGNTLSSGLPPLPAATQTALAQAEAWLTEQRTSIVNKLLAIFPFITGPQQNNNRDLFEKNSTINPPLDDDSWDRVAYTAGVYGRSIGKQELSLDQKNDLWDALVWAVQYERIFRPKLAVDRLNDLITFLNAYAENSTFLNYTLQGMHRVLISWEKAKLSNQERTNLKVSLKRIETILEKLPPSAEVTKRQEIINILLNAPAQPENSSIPKTDIECIAEAIVRLWIFLDQRFENKDRKLFNAAIQDLDNPQKWLNLAELSEVICRNAVYRYAHSSNLAGGNLSNKQLEDATLLATFSARYSTGDYIAKAEYYALLLNGLKRIRAYTLDPVAFASELTIKFANEWQAKAAGFSWSDLIGIATHQLNEQRRAKNIDKAAADAWVRVFANIVQELQIDEAKVFLAEARQHEIPDSIALKKILDKIGERKEQVSNPTSDLAILGDEYLKELLECIKDFRLERLKELLHENRTKLLAEFSRALSDQRFDEILPPRRSVYVRGRSANAPDRFEEARKLILSPNEAERREGLELFEQAKANTNGRNFIPIAHEWWLFALARAMGILRASTAWGEDRANSTASWEEIWNLTVFYMRTGRAGEALDILRPGVEKTIAPFSHLRFALYCSVQILEQERRFTREARDGAVSFLINYLEKLPLPICYLVWSLLVNEYPDNALPKANIEEQTRVLGIFQDILYRPVDILKPEEQLKESQVSAFQKHLQRLGLEDMWRLWINDYADRNRYNFGAWQARSDAFDRAGDAERAEKALLHIVDVQLDQLKKMNANANSFGQRALETNLRSSMYRLFDFYRRKVRLQDSDVEARFKRYYGTIPELWDGKNNANIPLIRVTRDLYDKATEKVVRKGDPLPPLPPGGGGQHTRVWMTLASELLTIQDVGELKSLQQRLVIAIELIAGEQKLAKERAATVIKVLNQLCALDARQWGKDDLFREVDSLNKAIQNAAALIEQESVLKTLKPLIGAFRKVFEKFNKDQKLFPKLQVDSVPLGGGLPKGISDTTLVLHITNPGPGEVVEVRINCTDKGIIASKKERIVDSIAQNQTAVVAIPVKVLSPESAEQVDCQINLTYQWGIMKDLPSFQMMSVKLFSFDDYLQQHSIHDYGFPNPYVFDEPIDFTRNDARLFQGREAELRLVHTVFFKGERRGVPLYFHGFRKVGKTSLLNRIAILLRNDTYAPFVVDLKGIRATQQPLEVVINSFTRRIRDVIQKQGLDVSGIEPVLVNDDNPIIGVEQFFTALRTCIGNRHPVLLLDEFYLLVAEQTTVLLDLLHRIHQSGLIWFILSGWYRPETLRRLCPDTQLFPLMGHSIDFLPLPVVQRVLSKPVADFGIEIPDATVERMFIQTAGNPYHIAKIAYNGILHLNADHRIVLAPQDIDDIAIQLAADQANFTSSTFSNQILNAEEQSVAIRFAKELGEKREILPYDQVTKMFSQDVIQQLVEKYLFEFLPDEYEGHLRIRGKMLTTFLRNSMSEPIPPPLSSNKKRVGIFVDYENLVPLIPAGMKAKEAGDMILNYAAHFGDIVCRWACADPRNISDWPSTKLGLERAGFQVQSPSGEPEIGKAQKNLTDFVVIERINDESTHTAPDIYFIVSGDKDYYEKITSLIRDEHEVRLMASVHDQHLAGKYRRLVEERENYRIVEAKTERDFFIDDLGEIFRAR